MIDEGLILTTIIDPFFNSIQVNIMSSTAASLPGVVP